MKDRGYSLEVGENGKARLDILNNIMNASSKNFLNKIELKSGMQVMELGCGVGQMSIWLAKQILPNGKVIAVDNSQEQIIIAKKAAQEQGIKNIEFIVHSAHEIDSLNLNNKLDMIFSRLVLVHLTDYKLVIEKLKNLLKDDAGVLIIQDVILSNVFSYPENKTLQTYWDLCKKNLEYQDKDPNIGKKLLSIYNELDLQVLDYEYHQPLLKTEDEKLQISRDAKEFKNSIIKNGLVDLKTIDNIILDLTLLARTLDLVVGYLPNIIIAGKIKK